MASTQTAGGRIRNIDDLEITVDADFHVTERQRDFITYLDDPFKSVVLRDGADFNMEYLQSFYPSAGLFVTGVVSGKIQNPTVTSRDDIREGMMLLEMDHVHVDPTLNLYLGGVHHDQLATALARAYNIWAIEQLYEPSDGIHGPILVAPQRPTDAAEEIDDRRNEAGISSVFIPSGGVHPPLGNECYNPIYDAAQSAGFPITLHSASGTQMLNFPLQFHGTNRYISNHAPTHAMTHMMHITDMVTRGVFVRFADLDFVFQEAGLGWVPYMVKRLDNEYAEKREDVPMLDHPPSTYINDRCYFTSQPVEGADDPDYISSIVRLLGPENLLFSSDYPHLDFDHSDYLLRALRTSLSDDELAGIYGETARRVFDL